MARDIWKSVETGPLVISLSHRPSLLGLLAVQILLRARLLHMKLPASECEGIGFDRATGRRTPIVNFDFQTSRMVS